MYLLGLSELGKRAQEAVRDDPRFAAIIAVEEEGTLTLYHSVRRQSEPEWAARHVEWAKIVPMGNGVYRLAHMNLRGHWQELDVKGTVTQCVQAIMANKYHLFFV